MSGFLIASFLSAAVAQTSGGEVVDAPFLHFPSLSRRHVAFLFKNQLWIANRDGTGAHRFLDLQGRQSYPTFSPDGEKLAFQADFEGNPDVYVAPVSGGRPRRITHLSLAAKTITQWSGAGILFNSNAQSFFGSADQIYLAPPGGGTAQKMPVSYGTEGALSPDGRYLAFTPLLNNFNETWKRYRGGMHRTLWLLDRRSGKTRHVSSWKGTDCEPMWHGSKIVFLSDAGPEGRLNLWSLDPRSRRRRQLTRFTGYDLRNASYDPGNGGEVAFECGARLFVYSLAKGTSSEIKVDVPREERRVAPRQLDASPYVSNLSLSADGSYAIAEARGDLWVLRAGREPESLTGTSGAFERFPACSPDGKWVAYFSDATGENQLWLMDTGGSHTRRQLTQFKSGLYSDPAWSPDSRRIAFADSGSRIWVYTLETGAVTMAAHDSVGFWLTFGWSADSQRLLFNRTGSNRLTAICSYDVRTGKTAQLTHGAYADYWPVASVDRTFFMSDRDYTRVRFDVNDKTYALSGIRVVLSAPSSLGFDQFERSAEQLAIRSGRLSNLTCVSDHLLAFTRVGESGERSLVTFDTSLKLERVVVPNIFGTPSFDRTRHRCLVQTPDGPQVVSLVGDSPTAALKARPMTMHLEPRSEWRQLERDFWRQCRDLFYNPNVPKPNWDVLWKRYEPMMSACVTRDDVNDVLSELLGELSTSHGYLAALGDVEPGPASAPIGMLGCDFELRAGRYVITKIYDFPWYARRNAPLAGTGVKTGDSLLAVNGAPLSPKEDVWTALVGLADKPVRLTIRTASGADRLVTVQPLTSEIALRYADWAEGRRRWVEKASGGRLGYIHLTGFGISDIPEFKRQLESATDRDGVVVDSRWSYGGFLSDIWAQMLARRPLTSFALRDGAVVPLGGYAPTGPVALLVNAMTISAGEGFAYHLRQMRVGRSFGSRTAGMFVGLNGNPPLIDNGGLNIPNAPYFDDRKWVIENFGFVPDEVVADDPSGNTDPQLEAAVRWAMAEIRRHPPKHPIRPKDGREPSTPHQLALLGRG